MGIRSRVVTFVGEGSGLLTAARVFQPLDIQWLFLGKKTPWGNHSLVPIPLSQSQEPGLPLLQIPQDPVLRDPCGLFDLYHRDADHIHAQNRFWMKAATRF